MRIFKKTDRTLTLWQNNWLSPWIPLGVALGGLFVALYSGEEVKLACYRATPLRGQCQIENNSFFNYQSRSISFDNIQKVDLEANSSKEEDASTRVLLVSKDGQTTPVTLDGNAEERDQIASQLATFLETPRDIAFKISDGNLNLGYLLAGATGLTGLAYMLAGGWTMVEFDKDKNECIVGNWGVTGKKIDRLAIKQISGVTLEKKQPVYLAAAREQMPHRLALVTNYQKTWPLGKKYRPATQRQQDQEVADQIAEFLEIDQRGQQS
jgi:hypothetical protein